MEQFRVDRGYIRGSCRVCEVDYMRQWKRKNRLRYNASARGYKAKRRAAKLKLPHVAYDSQEISARDDGVCVICGFQVDPERYDIEHIVPLQVNTQVLLSFNVGDHPGDVPWNVSVAHPSCNTSKQHRMSQEDAARYLLWRYLYKEQA